MCGAHFEYYFEYPNQCWLRTDELLLPSKSSHLLSRTLTALDLVLDFRLRGLLKPPLQMALLLATHG